jgi:hypothetical protein
MAAHPIHRFFELGSGDPDFVRQFHLWAGQYQSDTVELVVATKRTIATSNALMAEVDRALAGRWGRPS